MVTKRQYQILNSCADDWELFYFPFAFVNYDGQVFRRTDPAEKVAMRLGLNMRISPSRYEEEGHWSVSVIGLEIAWDIRVLVALKLLHAQRVLANGAREPVGPEGLSRKELFIYRDYDCLTFDDHLEAFGYGPHEFMISKMGLKEIERSVCRGYDKELGWPLS